MAQSAGESLQSILAPETENSAARTIRSFKPVFRMLGLRIKPLSLRSFNRLNPRESRRLHKLVKFRPQKKQRRSPRPLSVFNLRNRVSTQNGRNRVSTQMIQKKWYIIVEEFPILVGTSASFSYDLQPEGLIRVTSSEGHTLITHSELDENENFWEMLDKELMGAIDRLSPPGILNLIFYYLNVFLHNFFNQNRLG